MSRLQFAVHLPVLVASYLPYRFAHRRERSGIAAGPIESNMTRDRVCEMTASNTFLTGIRTSDKAMRVQIAACLLCVMVVGGSLDSLPDPPAVRPQHDQNNLISQRDYHVPLAAESHASDFLTCAPHLHAEFSSIGKVFEGGDSSHKFAFVRQATDTSPPCFF